MFSGSANLNNKGKIHMSETSIIAIILSFIAVCGTLGGTWLGRLLERSNETRKWRRECCLEAYTKVLRSCRIVLSEAGKAYWETECGTLEHANQDKVVFEKVQEMDRAVDKAFLLGPWDIQESLDNLANHCGKEIGTKSVKCPKLPEDEWHKVCVTDFVVVYGEFCNAARNDLELFPKRYRIEGIAVYNKTIKELEEELSKGTISPEQAELRIKDLKMKLKKDRKEWDKKDLQARKNK